MGDRCPYAAEVWNYHDSPHLRLLLRCRRRRTRWPHLHRARLHGARSLYAHINVEVRWRSTNTPDYHVEYERGTSEVIE